MLKPFRCLLTADIHGRSDTPNELRLFLQELDDYARLAKERSLDKVVVAGDFYHFKYRFSQELLVRTYETLEKHYNNGVQFIILRGNHDSSDTAQSEETILKLFSRVATIVSTPMLIEEADAVVLLLPWYPPEQFRKLLQNFGSYALAINKPRILISHVSLQEGRVSPSNVRLTTPIRYKDLLPEIWTGGVYLGDYHAHQQFGRRSDIYLGSARARTFGDFDCVGAWEVSASGRRLAKLSGVYPQFKTWRVDNLGDLPLDGYAASDYNRCYCALKLQSHVAQLYPGMTLLPPEMAVPETRGRISIVDPQDKHAVAKRWLELKKLGGDYATEVKRYLA